MGDVHFFQKYNLLNLLKRVAVSPQAYLPGLIVFDKTGQIKEVNNFTLKRSGHNKKELLKKKIWELLAEPQQENFRRFILNMIETGETPPPQIYQMPAKTPAQEYNIMAHYCPHFNAKGYVKSVSAISIPFDK